MSTPKLFALLLIGAATAAAQPVISNGGVLNGASFQTNTSVSPGSLVSIFGSGLATGLQSGDTIPLSTIINGTSVTFNGIPAGLYFASTGQVNAQMPWDALQSGTSSGTVNAVVTINGTNSAPMPVPVNLYSPGVFSIPPGQGYAVAINQDGSLAAPAGAIPGFATHPAKAGDVLIVYATGLGPVDSPIANGAASADKLRHTIATPTVKIGTADAGVPFSGLTPQFPGINQLNITVPSGVTGNSLPLQITIGGVTSPATAIIAVQ
jgi:uncharacterized protein (TIGR03437 family)